MSGERQDRAYDVAAKAYREILRERKPEDSRLLEQSEASQVLEVKGTYDHIGSVLRATGVPFISASPGGLDEVDWNRVEVAWVNCPGCLPQGEIELIAEWVRAGGYLGTTDWALKHLLEPAFPRKVRHNGGAIPDCVVKVEAVAESPLLAGFIEDGRDPLWWMESSSFPCTVLDPAVRVLLKSSEVGSQFGADAIVVEWDEGRGKVLHLVSHLYLQRSEVRDSRDRASAKSYFEESGFRGSQASMLAAGAGDLTASELKSAFTSASLATELMLEKKRRGR